MILSNKDIENKIDELAELMVKEDIKKWSNWIKVLSERIAENQGQMDNASQSIINHEKLTGEF